MHLTPTKIVYGILVTFVLCGCQASKSVYNQLACGAGNVCTDDFPRSSLAKTTPNDSLLLAPPYFEFQLRDIDGNYTTVPTLSPSIPKSTLDNYQLHAESYEVAVTPLHLEADGQEALLTQLYHSTFIELPAFEPPSASLTDVLQSSFSNAPQRQDPISLEQLPIDSQLTLAAVNNGSACCLLLTRISGWQESRESYNASVATAIIFSPLTGSSGATGYAGEVIIDMAVVRLQDGQVLWSSQTTGPVTSHAIRRGINHFYATVYNLRHTNKPL